MSRILSLKAWARVGRILTTVLGLVAVVGTIYLNCNPGGPDLVARCDYNTYALPPDLVETLDGVKQSQSYDAIREELEAFRGGNSKPVGFQEYELAQRLNVFFEARWPRQFRYGGNPYQGLWHITIENSGNRIADDVVLDVPLTGVALVTGRDEAQKVHAISRTLSLGSLRPGDSVAVAIWSEERPWPRPDGFRLTHSLGVGDVSFPSTVYGLRAFVARNLGFIAYFILTAIFAVASALVLSRFEMSRGRRREGESPE